MWNALSAVVLVVGAADSAPDFAREVRPILSTHCFKCHGPDDARREAGVRFDVRDSALVGGDSGQPAIRPGKPGDSELMRRITSTDENEVMPPPSAKLPLTLEQVATLRRWIESGAEYQPHWAFVKPRAGAPPQVAAGSRVENPIDRFVLARLSQEGLTPSSPADRATLIRRVTLDLIGLPPSPQDVAAFVADESPDAYEKVVDRLLASPRYGERWARRWLDLARYADTNGYEKDRQRSVWPYRDWVIRALNADEPFDEFTIDQIAGDLRPGATEEQRIATGFHRNTMLNEEGGIDPLEFRFYAMADRVGTTGTTWLGLTLMCAQCHTHKFDPILQREYYEVMACLNNADEVKLPVRDAAVTQERGQVEQQIRAAEEALASKFPLPPDGTCQGLPEAERRAAHFEKSLAGWIAQQREAARAWTTMTPSKMTTNLPRLTIEPDGSVFASGDQTKRDVYTLQFAGDFEGATALRLEALPDPRLPKGGPGRTYYEGPEGDFVLSEMTVDVIDDAGRPHRAQLANGTESYGKLGIGGGTSGAALVVDGEFHTGWSTSGREGEPHQAVWKFAEPLPRTEGLVIEMVFEAHYSAPLGRFRLSVSHDPREPAAKGYPAEVESALLKPESEWTESERSRITRAFLQASPELAMAREEIAALRKQVPEFPTALVFQERPADNPRVTHVYKRGEFLSPLEEVAAGTLGVLHPFPPDAARNRLGFAEWLVSRENPLVARVIVNRHWAVFFGRGIVRTTEDFGYQGAPPSHPELLDWLSVDFMRDWSVKRMHRQIVTSATYRQASSSSADQLARDPENRFLARGPRVRVDAEVVRDSALAVGGLLSDKMQGPSVFPPQPASVTTEGAYGQLPWTVSTGEDRYRRGLYTFMKRTTPYAMFTTFDGPSGEACVARRDISNTPLQALTLLNDQVMLESAQALGRAATALPGLEDRGRIAWIVRGCLSRNPTDDELTAYQAFVGRQRERFQAAPERAAQFAGEGSSPEVATWTAVARAVLNLDEFVTRE